MANIVRKEMGLDAAQAAGGQSYRKIDGRIYTSQTGAFEFGVKKNCGFDWNRLEQNVFLTSKGP